MSDLWADLDAASREPGPTMTITKAQYAALRAAVSVPTPHKAGEAHDYSLTCKVCGEFGTLRVSVEPQSVPEEPR